MLLEVIGKKAKNASRKLAVTPEKIKNYALEKIADALMTNADYILQANSLDLEAGTKKDLSKALLDRLSLDGKRVKAMADGLTMVKGLPDPIGEVLGEWRRPNGLRIKKVRVPLGVIGIIYEARPNVTVDSAALCVKAGNAVILRGGSDAIKTNVELTRIITAAAYEAGIPEGAIQLIEDTDRSSAEELMRAREYVDVLIPRGGKNLIQTVVSTSTVPVIETGEGNCHAYVEKSADLKMAAEIVYNAKVSRPSVCNAIETLLVDEAIAEVFLPPIKERLAAAGVELRGCPKSRRIIPEIKAATEEDWRTEFLGLVLAVKVVAGVDEAIAHINKYGTKHSETIVTKDKGAMKKFGAEVDAAAVYTNASTRFTDGFEFGFGAEIGISTQKLHARGPMGLPELTSYKYIIEGSGQIRV
ncbi:glutamate-5-semialdehyde dehydrogenase [candidate division WOR-1 bacterium RIFOXYA12_FULL_52_29]|uniref:Gamma-glutamyl phosphate reductase n=1 Tax=candidate division WOR-1 bacterium RIFOXYC12_FULL_54_18 TaxID=1802584 RepID=A0A1F4T6Q1_UNCSA|nr:MAG: glutamate-5-semialdehyde dehydrogenase [candidate division WOR-1 bacterium RIFOXYA2_FULL_51_19]OGC17859.1 MAG: glutamate-5-semialdehyde dehydrogenase [candidate division WOR-1 bacterium RIFOXYA12_FULL_52_29]OGC26716.1 MAG: glutamate-5-semialdehyde dehydrogenase [candidate division WOR-1 bacterium RIFOXYB2_FULL_45_9]OGC28276.1 MAG: glutamate-5-semialdehyde dehydrogenase [candidate division WOR-1 bacterium RIFOXYC12_FULL_54_18]OGC31266.1 MAG: glutamate-5-semialdehyde dehydrogenase [candid